MLSRFYSPVIQAPIPTRPIEVSMSEVEAKLLRLGLTTGSGEPPAVAEAHACMRTVDGKQQLAAYVCPETVDAAAVTAALAQSVHEYLVPAFLVPLPRLPRDADGTPQPYLCRHLHPQLRIYRSRCAHIFHPLLVCIAGAVDEGQLPAVTVERAYVPPTSAVETELQQLWMEVLGLERAEQVTH